MVIGKSFAWGHLGKTAGETTGELFQLFPELVVTADRIGTQEQHTSFLDRRSEIRGKELALNIRRLPSWMLSYHMHRAKWGVYPAFEPQPMMSPLEIAQDDVADEHLAHFTGGGELKIAHWLRVEHLAHDFLAFVGQYLEVSAARREQVTQFRGVNAAIYNREVDHWFSAAHISLMYRSNPQWAAAEEAVYGGTLAPKATQVAGAANAPGRPLIENRGAIRTLLGRVFPSG